MTNQVTEYLSGELDHYIKHGYKLRLYLINGDVLDISGVLSAVNDWCIMSRKKGNVIHILLDSIVYFQVRR